MMTSVAFLKAVMVYAWATSMVLSFSSGLESSQTSTQEPGSAKVEDSALQTSTDYTITTLGLHDVLTPTLTTSQFQDPTSTTPDTTSTQSQMNTILAELSSLVSRLVEPTFSSNHTSSRSSPSLSSNGDNDTAQLSSTSDSLGTTIVYSTTFNNTDPSDDQSSEASDWLFSTSQSDPLSPLYNSESTEVFAESSFSGEPQDTSVQMWSSHTQPTSTVDFQTTSVSTMGTDISPTPSSTSVIMATSTPETPSQKPSPQENPKGDSTDDLSSGSKVAIGVFVAVGLIGVIVAGVVVYRRYNITHRSLKSFLTSGIRYKTYNNAIYKDDEVVAEVGIASQLT